ncbi:uncharacterized protein Tco025E_07104 [Trypanosoma conorhini]|uniref:Uncharacterized protein n=1 Tax=Trypanosoma conorhini TaxID=83891 RepID=A0A3R7NMM2_9TRYP|nr:uncharacterized protein Tco025E_07104 [Trypanosoma conorhini]RNF08715.1 hypothetical protein Tco025E_07104 [Trypanosoma conorhini]
MGREAAPVCRAPRRPTAAGGRRTSRHPSQLLEPYAQPLLRRVPSSSSSAAVAVRRSSRAAALPRQASVESPAQPSFATTGIDALHRLTLEEWSVCSLMATVLQRKSTEEAERIAAEVTKLALHRRLLAGYSGVYADGAARGGEHALAAEDNGRKAELIRRLQEQQRREEERRAHLCVSNRRFQQDDLRALCRKLFSHGGANGRGGSAAAAASMAKKKGSAHRRKTPSDRKLARRQQQGGHNNVKEITVTKKPISVPSVPTNVPRRAKPHKAVPSFDEVCADRYCASGYSNESTPTVSIGSYAAMSAADDSVQRSNSFTSPGAPFYGQNIHESTSADKEAVCVDAGLAPSMLFSTMRPASARALMGELVLSSEAEAQPPELLDGHHRAGLAPVQPTNPAAAAANLSSSKNNLVALSPLSSLISPSSSSATTATDACGAGHPRHLDGDVKLPPSWEG